MVQIVGIVNLTTDSFSDGGHFLAADQAIRHGETLLDSGADWLDLGAESSHPKGQKVDAAEELARLTPVIKYFTQRGIKLAIDTYKPEVMRTVLDLGVAMINDITALRDDRAARLLAQYQVPIVLMFARNQQPRAQQQVQPYRELIPELLTFFEHRLTHLDSLGIKRERLILDPGMGFFLGSNPEPSLWVLKHLNQLHTLDQPLYLSMSRKSFIGTLLNKPVHERTIGTLTTEIWAMQQGVSYLRTHNVEALWQARSLWQAITQVDTLR